MSPQMSKPKKSSKRRHLPPSPGFEQGSYPPQPPTLQHPAMEQWRQRRSRLKSAMSEDPSAMQVHVAYVTFHRQLDH